MMAWQTQYRQNAALNSHVPLHSADDCNATLTRKHSPSWLNPLHHVQEPFLWLRLSLLLPILSRTLALVVISPVQAECHMIQR